MQSLVEIGPNVLPCSYFVSTTIAVIMLRKKEPHTERPYRIPYAIGPVPLLPVIGIGLVLLLMAYAFYALSIT